MNKLEYQKLVEKDIKRTGISDKKRREIIVEARKRGILEAGRASVEYDSDVSCPSCHVVGQVWGVGGGLWCRKCNHVRFNPWNKRALPYQWANAEFLCKRNKVQTFIFILLPMLTIGFAVMFTAFLIKDVGELSRAIGGLITTVLLTLIVSFGFVAPHLFTWKKNAPIIKNLWDQMDDIDREAAQIVLQEMEGFDL